jgi:hypothetical protein
MRPLQNARSGQSQNPSEAKMSKVYRFDGPARLLVNAEPVLLRKRKKRPLTPFWLVAADACSITDKDGTRPIETYRCLSGQRAVTLTRQESDSIALSNPGMQPPMALEDLQPWLPKQSYRNDSVSSFRTLKSIVKQFDQKFVYASAYCDQKWNTVCNSLRQKNALDARFYTAWHLPIQEAYVLEENRPGRSVVAIDFNGMYLACMQHLFPKPSGLRLVRLNTALCESTALSCGLYRCIIEGPLTEFIISHNPFRSFYSGRQLRTRLDDPVEVDLNEFELEFFRHHFKRIYLIEAVISDKVVAHPLAKEVRRSFAKRRNYRHQGNKALADREKYIATLMTSCSHRPARLSQTFETLGQAMASLGIMYGIVPSNDEPEVATSVWLQGRKGISLRSQNPNTAMQGPNTHDGSACFLLAQRIVARGRIVLLEMMERILLRGTDIEICYTNIDSIHFSLPTEHLAPLLGWLKSEGSDALGSFKIESVTRHGLWLEPGRYWLYSDEIVKFRNRSIGSQRQPFKDYSTYVVNRQLGELNVPIKATIRMDRSMSPTRSVSIDADSGLTRQRLIEIGNGSTFNEVLDELEHNHRHATPVRMAAFAALRERMGSPRCAVTKRGDDTDIV